MWGPVRSSLHAKCVVVDTEHVFVSSAIFTEAGQERNIEVGLKLRSQLIAGQLIRHFRMLREGRNSRPSNVNGLIDFKPSSVI